MGECSHRFSRLIYRLFFLETEGEPLSMEETKDFLEEIDANADGEVTQNEFMRMMEAPLGLEEDEEG